MELKPEERERIEAIRDRPVTAHPLEKGPYEIDAYRSSVGKKEEVKAERKKLLRARVAWADLHPATHDWFRVAVALKIVDALEHSSIPVVAKAMSTLTRDDLELLQGELGHVDRYEEEQEGWTVLLGPLVVSGLFDSADAALSLPPYASEKVPNLRDAVEALYLIWRRDELRETPRTGKAAINAIAPHVSELFLLPRDQSEREVRAQLSELAKQGRLPKFV